MDKVAEIIDALTQLTEDSVVPKNVKSRISDIIGVLKSNLDLSIKIDKALQELDEIADDSNLQPFTRTQVYNIISMLEVI